MPDLNKTREILEVAFINGWAAQTPIEFDNVVFDDKTPDAFVSVSIINYTSENVCIGSAISKRIRHQGVLSVKVYTKQNIGTGEAHTYAKNVSDILSNIDQTRLFTKASLIKRNGSTNDGWFGLIVDTPYVSDEI